MHVDTGHNSPETIQFRDDIDISPGDMIVGSNNKPEASQDIEVMLA
jgi:sulfate adenylyltransferase subunit 1